MIRKSGIWRNDDQIRRFSGMTRHQDNGRPGDDDGSVARRSTNSMISKRCLGPSFRNALNSRRLSTVSLGGAASFL
jgi:hypothetical protein